MSEVYAMLVGLDWADQKHDLRCYEVASQREEAVVLSSAPDAVEEWVLAWAQRFPGQRLAICLEQSRGPVVYELAKYDFVDLYPVNPMMLRRYREAFCPSGSKDDPKDAALLMDLLRRHPEGVKRLEPDDACTRMLRLLCEDRRKAVDARTALMNALRDTLKQYYPQALSLAGESLHTEQACALLMKWPRFERIAAADPTSVRAFYYAHSCRAEAAMQTRLELLRSSCALTQDPSIVEPCMLRVQTLVGQIRGWNKAIAQYDQRIAQQWKDHPDAAIFQSLPGAGPQLEPRLAVAFGTNRQRYDSAQEFSTYAGVAPVIAASGKQRWVHWRWHCPTFLRQSLVEFADHSIGRSLWARVYYQTLRERGKGHHAAVRALAFKWNRILYRCWQTRMPYDEAAYIQALRTHGSWIAQKITV